MRRASQNVGIVTDAGNALLSFGYDYCSEHEWGIKGIRQTFGVSGDEADLTVGRLAVTRADATNLHLIEAKNRQKEARVYLLGQSADRLYGHTPADYVVQLREGFDQRGEASSLWDERAFLFSVSKGGDAETTVRTVHRAMLDKDALIYLSSSANPFGGSGLVIAKWSAIPREAVASMEDGFADQKRLKDASEATGIRERVEVWGRTRGNRFGSPFYALSPSWLRDGFTTVNGPRKSAHPVIYWLNPSDQQNNSAGWYTVEELDQWIQGKGPIPKTSDKKRA